MSEATTPTTPDALTQRLYDRADLELKERIRLAFKPAQALWDYPGTAKEVVFNTGGTGIAIDPAYANRKVHLPRILRNCETMAFESLRDENRAAAVAAFLLKVEKLQEQIDELRDVTDNIQNQ